MAKSTTATNLNMDELLCLNNYKFRLILLCRSFWHFSPSPSLGSDEFTNVCGSAVGEMGMSNSSASSGLSLYKIYRSLEFYSKVTKVQLRFAKDAASIWMRLLIKCDFYTQIYGTRACARVCMLDWHMSPPAYCWQWQNSRPEVYSLMTRTLARVRWQPHAHHGD